MRQPVSHELNIVARGADDAGRLASFRRVRRHIMLGGIVVVLCHAGALPALDADAPPLPQLRRVGDVTQLYVDGEPFLALGGELGNSTASNLDVLERALARCAAMKLNTVMLPVYWDLVEPAEGTFDFTLVEGAIVRAREHNLRLVLLWFGTWKNSMSCYAPSWVKRDSERFPRVEQRSGEKLEIISPASTAASEADAVAFAALMRRLKDFDSQDRTVIMVQVENEVGMIPEARDHSPASERDYRGDVPQELASMAAEGKLGPEVAALWEAAGRRTAGTWSEMFGEDAWGEEVFSAWQLARYVERVVAAGKREYPLPMLVNAALVRPGYKPGEYPSAGPLPHLFEVWRAAAPSLDMLSPDIYFPNFTQWCERYVRGGNPLFVPEMAPSMRAAGNALYAVARHGAIGCGPFAIESVDQEKERLIASCYGMLTQMADRVLQAQQQGTVLGFAPQVEFDWNVDDAPQRGTLGGVVFEARFDRPGGGGDTQTTTLPTLGPGRWEAPPGAPLGAAMILQQGPEEFLIAGMGVIVTFAPASGEGKVGIDRVQEGHFAADGTWVGGRWLGGDQTHQGRHVHLYDGGFTVQRVTLYRY